MQERMTDMPGPAAERGYSDDELDSSFYPVRVIGEEIAKPVIRAAARAEYRWLMWKAFQDRMADATADSPDRMPWDPPRQSCGLPHGMPAKC
jgi:hypothetical protein